VPVKQKIVTHHHLPDYAKSGIMVMHFENEDLTRQDRIFEAHRDTHALFNFATTGRCSFLLDFKKHQLEAPVLLMVFPGQVHQIEHCTGVTGYSIGFDPLLMTPELTKTLECIFQSPLPLDVSTDFYQELNQLLALLYTMYDKASGSEQTAAFQSLLISTLQWTAGQLKRNCSCQSPATDRARTIEADFKSLLQEHYVKHKRPSFYSERLNISTTHLGDTLKTLTGKSITQHIQELSFLDAKRYLYNTDLSIKEICFLVGYDDPVHFGKLFKRHCQLTPLEFRKQIRE